MTDLLIFFFKNRHETLILLDDADGFLKDTSQEIANFMKVLLNSSLKPISSPNQIRKKANSDLKKENESIGRVGIKVDTSKLLGGKCSVICGTEKVEFDVDLKMSDIRKDTFCSSGPGGQSVNTTYSAIRLTHIPTGIVVSCQDQKSQIKNFDKALTVLRTRLFELEYNKYLNDIASKRKTMVSTGDRSAKIRTYNYPQSRVTDHRINWTMYNLPVFMDGEIQEVLDALQLAENAERLKEAVS